MFKDGVIVWVYEPISLLIKLFIGTRMGISARAFVTATIVCHALGSVGSFFLSRAVRTHTAYSPTSELTTADACRSTKP